MEGREKLDQAKHDLLNDQYFDPIWLYQRIKLTSDHIYSSAGVNTSVATSISLE